MLVPKYKILSFKEQAKIITHDKTVHNLSHAKIYNPKIEIFQLLSYYLLDLNYEISLSIQIINKCE